MQDISVVKDGRSWAVKHGDSYLGHVPTRQEADAIAALLIAETPFAPVADHAPIAGLAAVAA